MDPQIFEWPEINDHRGSLSVAQYPHQIPFLVERVFYLYNIKAGETRGHHAHKKLQQFVICLSGGCEIELQNSIGDKTRFALSKPNQGVYVPQMFWTVIENFKPGTICLVLASMPYLEEDYIRDQKSFLRKS